MNKSELGVLDSQLRYANRKLQEYTANGDYNAMIQWNNYVEFLKEKLNYYMEDAKMKKARIERIFANEISYLQGRIEASEKTKIELPHTKEYYEGGIAALMSVFEAIKKD